MKHNDVNPWIPLHHSKGAVNSLGLPSKGADAIIRNIDGFRKKYNPIDFPIGISIMGHPKQDPLQSTLDCLNKVLAYSDFIEINKSCPNVNHTDDNLDHRFDSIVRKRDSYRSISGHRFPYS
ncbi:MAG: hypothetical protein ACLFP2_04130 [Candidatus Woesearchaeota archaeon]